MSTIPYKPALFSVPTTTTTVAQTSPQTARTTSEGEIVTTEQPSTTTPGEVCERVMGMDDPQLVPDQFIVVSFLHRYSCFSHIIFIPFIYQFSKHMEAFRTWSN